MAAKAPKIPLPKHWSLWLRPATDRPHPIRNPARRGFGEEVAETHSGLRLQSIGLTALRARCTKGDLAQKGGSFMNPTTKRVAVVMGGLLLVVGVGYGGYLAGKVKSSYDWQVSMITANAVMLSQRISWVADLRAGQTDAVAHQLLFPIDNLIGMTACRPGRGIDNFDPDKLPSHQLNALKLARAYTDAVPDTPLSDQSRQLLRQVDALDIKFCSPTLQALLESSSKK